MTASESNHTVVEGVEGGGARIIRAAALGEEAATAVAARQERAENQDRVEGYMANDIAVILAQLTAAVAAR